MSFSVLWLFFHITRPLTTGISPVSPKSPTLTPPKTSASLHLIWCILLCNKYRCFWWSIEHSSKKYHSLIPMSFLKRPEFLNGYSFKNTALGQIHTKLIVEHCSYSNRSISFPYGFHNSLTNFSSLGYIYQRQFYGTTLQWYGNGYMLFEAEWSWIPSPSGLVRYF